MLTCYVLATYPIANNETRQRPSSIIGTIEAQSLLDAAWDVRDLILKLVPHTPIERVDGLEIHLKNGVTISISVPPVDSLSVWLTRAATL